MKFFLMTIALLVVTACGYKPSAHYIKNIFAESVYVEVKVDSVEPENAPFVRDELNRMIYTRFKGNITTEDLATSKIYASYGGSSFSPLAYEDGYVTRYRANIRVHFKMETEDANLTKAISSRVEEDIQASSLTSSTLRTEAIRQGLAKALDEFIAYVSAKGMIVSQEYNASKVARELKAKNLTLEK